MAIDKFNRKNLLSAACLVWSISSFVTGSVSSIAVVGLMRVMLGMSVSFYEPASYSLVADIYP